MTTRVSPRLPPPAAHGSTNNAKIIQNNAQTAHTPQTEGRMSRSRDSTGNAASRTDKSQSTASASRTSLAPPTNAISGRNSVAPSPPPPSQNNPNSSSKVASSKSSSTAEISTDSRSSNSKSVEVFMDGSDLVTCTTQPLFYTDPNTGIAHLVRLVRIHTASSYKPSISPSSFMPTASLTTPNTATTNSSSTAASTSQSNSHTYSSSEIYVRAGDLCMVFLHNKHSVSNFIRDFNQPYEKALLRVAKAVPRDAYCLTARGVRRFLQTKRIKVMSNFHSWISQCLAVMMRPGNENMPVPRMAIRPKNATDAPNPDAAPQQSTSRAKNRSAGPIAVTPAAGNSSSNGDDEPTVDLDTSGDADEADEDRREALTRKLRFTYPSEADLESWRAASLTSSQSLAREEDEKTARHVAENALATVAGRGHSVAGRNWAEGKGLFEGKQTRLGPRFQAVLQPMLTEKQRIADVGRWDDELISDPLNVTPRFPPLSSFYKIDPSDEQSRRLKRKKFDALQSEARRTRKDFNEGNDTERPARSPFEGNGPHEKIKGFKSAEEIEANAWRKVLSTLMRRDLSRNDFEVSLMTMFIAPGALLRIFTHTMPKPHLYGEAFDITAIENFLPTKRAEEAQRFDLAAETEAADAANGGLHKKRRMEPDPSSSSFANRNISAKSDSTSTSPSYRYNSRSAKSDSPPPLSAIKAFDPEVDLPALVPIRVRNSSSESSASPPVKAH